MLTQRPCKLYPASKSTSPFAYFTPMRFFSYVHYVLFCSLLLHLFFKLILPSVKQMGRKREVSTGTIKNVHDASTGGYADEIPLLTLWHRVGAFLTQGRLIKKLCGA